MLLPLQFGDPGVPANFGGGGGGTGPMNLPNAIGTLPTGMVAR